MPPDAENSRPAWRVPRIWNGTAVILGGGPSMLRAAGVTREQDDVMDNMERFRAMRHHWRPILEGVRCIGVNNMFILGAWVDAVFFGDCQVYSWYRQWFMKYGGLKVTCCQRVPPEGKGWPNIKKLNRAPKHTGIETKTTEVAWNDNSGSAAINLAYHLGARKIVLLGFDMRKEADEEGNTRQNCHTMHANGDNALDQQYVRWWNNMKVVADDAARLGVELVNATPGSALQDRWPQRYPYVPIQDALKKGESRTHGNHHENGKGERVLHVG